MFSIFLFKIMFIFLPGMVSTVLINSNNSERKELSIHEWVIYSFILGALSYLILGFFIPVDMFSMITNEESFTISPKELIGSLLIGCMLSLLLLKIKNNEIFHLFTRKLNVSSKIGNKYILENIFLTSDPEISRLKDKWVNLRFRKEECHFIGLIKNCGFVDSKLELLLIEVSAYYDNKDAPSYEVEALYFCLNPEDIYIEFL